MNPQVVLAAACIASSAAAQTFVMMPDSSNDRIVLLDPFDGTVVNSTFIPDDASGTLYDFQTPKDVLQVGNEIWVFDQVSDQIIRFDLQGAHVATILPVTGMVDNMRGGAFANNTIYVSNDGSGNGATADTLVMFDTGGTRLGTFSTLNSGSSPFDVLEFNGELLVSHFTATNAIAKYDYAGTPLANFHSSNGTSDVDSPEQLSLSSTGTVFAAGFGSPAGVYEYDAAGTLVNSYVFSSNLRGVIELGNGLLLVSDGSGAKTYDRATAALATVYSSTGCQYFNLLTMPPSGPIAYCTAGVSTNGCVPSISGSGTPSVAASSGFTIDVANVEGQKQGLLFYGISGQNNAPWGTSSSFLCVKAPTQRMGTQFSGGTAGACDGALSEDWLAYMAGHPGALGTPLTIGQVIDAQGWYRDPPSPKTTNLSNGLEFTLEP